MTVHILNYTFQMEYNDLTPTEKIILENKEYYRFADEAVIKLLIHRQIPYVTEEIK